MKRVLKRIGISILGILIILFVVVIILFWHEIRSLASLKKTDGYGMYQMTYYGDYGFDKFLETGAKNDADIEAFVTKRLLKGLPIDLGVTDVQPSLREMKTAKLYMAGTLILHMPRLCSFTQIRITATHLFRQSI